jgi:uncharacterized membrane protein SpoIIM required for sporulation
MSNYISKHKPEWEELQELVTLARKSMKNMKPEELARMDVLYRQTTVHLAQVASRTKDIALLNYLNDLTAAAHSVIYLPPRRAATQTALMFVTDGFARAVARTWMYHAASGALMIFGALLAYFAVWNDPLAAYAIMPAMEVRLPGSTQEQLLDALRHGRGMQSGDKFIFASFLFSHNFKVGLATLALGVLAAVPSIILIVYNGMIVGAFTAIHHNAGIYAEYWAWILPHGVTELSAIVLCGGIGLQLGRSVVCPGMHNRAESLRLAGLDAMRISLGVGAMLVFAAIIESYLRQSHLPMWGRYLFAAGTFVLWSLYFFRGWLLERAEAHKAAQLRMEELVTINSARAA